MAERRAIAAVAVLVGAALALTACTSSAGRSGPSRVSITRTAPSDGPSTPGSERPATVATGTITSRAIPGGSTRYRPRPALVYLPPAARTHPGERFPLLMLLHGTSGSPGNFVTRGSLRTTLDAFAAAHGGRAPVVVMPDINGSLTADTECIRTKRGGDVEAYLQTVVPAWALAHLPVTRERQRWGIGGLSEGATCALVLGLRDPAGWRYVGDYFGLRRVTVGDTDDPAATIARLFGGSRAAYDAHDPSVLLRVHRYPRLAVWFECGAADRVVLRDQTALAALARHSVGAVRSTTIPGGHGWSTFRALFPTALPWFWARVG